VSRTKAWRWRTLQIAAGQAGHAPYLRRGLSAIGSWTGTPLRDFLKIVGADTAQICWFSARQGRYNSRWTCAPRCIADQMTFKFADEILPRAYGFPMKIRCRPSSASRTRNMSLDGVTNDYKGGYWEDQDIIHSAELNVGLSVSWMRAAYLFVMTSSNAIPSRRWTEQTREQFERVGSRVDGKLAPS